MPESLRPAARPIVVYDAVHDRADEIARRLVALGPVLSEVGPPTRRRERPAESVLILVGLPDSFPSDVSVLEWIALCRRSAPVIGYAQGADTWPIRYKAEVLLAGCTALLDLASTTWRSSPTSARSRATPSH